MGKFQVIECVFTSEHYIRNSFLSTFKSTRMTSKLLTTFAIILLLVINSSSQTKSISINEDIQLVPITNSLYAHVTWINSEKWGRFSNNGAVYINNGKAFLIDTPMDSLQTVQLVTFLRDSMQTEVTHFIPGHYHDDCIAGLPYLHSLGVLSIANNLTIKKCEELNLEQPQTGFNDSINIDFEETQVNVYYMGGGHTVDNVVVYFNDEKVLFGGCFVKANSAGSLGNLKDATVDKWPVSIQKTIEKFSEVEKVIPGHGSIEGPEQLHHTLELLNKHLANKK